MSDLGSLLKKMVGGTTPKSFAQAATCLGLRDYGFPSELEARAFVDGFGDLGLDGIGLALDEAPILDFDDVSHLLDAGSPFTLRIFFLQAKRGEFVNASDVVLFGAAVQRFLTLTRKEIERLKPNPDALHHWALYDKVRQISPDLVKRAHITALFAYAGEWRDFATVNTAREQSELNITNVLPDARLEFVIWGERAILEAGQRVGPEFRKSLRGVNLLPLPADATGGYIGYVSARGLADFASRKMRGKREMHDFMFLDNVRHFLGTDSERENPGAVGLARTLQKGQQNRVLLCHNGVVIVASSGTLAADGHAIELTAPQIVNGCQSTSVLVENADKLAQCFVPLKIVLTEEEELKDAIVLASNTQAAVDDYDMLARNEGLRELQNIFQRGVAPLHERIWLQRRRNEPVDWPEHWERKDWLRIVRPRHLLDAYAAAILGTPHIVHDKPVNVLELARDGIVFDLAHEPTLYRALGWLIVAGRKWAARHNKKWQDRFAHSAPSAYPARHHFVCALWRIADVCPTATASADIAKSGAANKRFQALIDTLVNNTEALGDAAAKVVEEAASKRGDRLDSNLVTRRYFTEEVLRLADEARPSVRNTLTLTL